MAGETGLYARDYYNPSIIRTLLASSDGFLISIPSEIQETQDGKFFYTSFYNATLGSGANLDIHFVTGAASPQIGVNVDSGAASLINFYEGITTSANGSALPVYNANRNSSKVSEVLAYSGPTVTGTGTNFFGPHYISGGTTGSAAGGSSSNFARINAFILKPATKYLFRINNLGANAVGASMQIGWYEDV